jgi:hypothetical protein
MVVSDKFLKRAAEEGLRVVVQAATADRGGLLGTGRRAIRGWRLPNCQHYLTLSRIWGKLLPIMMLASSSEAAVPDMTCTAEGLAAFTSLTSFSILHGGIEFHFLGCQQTAKRFDASASAADLQLQRSTNT